MRSGLTLANVGFVGSLGYTAGGGPLPDIVLNDSDTPPIVYSIGWQTQIFADYVGGSGSFNVGTGAYYEITIPAGYTRVVFSGILNGAGADFDVSVNGVVVASANQRGANDGANHTTYYDYTGASGETVRLTKTGGAALFADLITIKAS